MTFFNELKRRNVFRVGAAYLVLSWLLIQIVDTLGDMLALPEAVGRTVLLLLAIGFPIVMVVSWIFEVTPDGIQTQSAADQSGLRASPGKLNAVVIGGLILIIVLLVVDNYVLVDSPQEAISQPVASATDDEPFLGEITQTQGLELSIAVLPFSDLSPGGDQEYFADGLSEEILNKLAQVRDLFVVARTSSFYFKGRNEDMRSIGEQLGVNYILEGSVRKAGESLRITTQLIQADNGYNLWSQTYDRNIADIFAIQDEISMEVTRALSITLGADEFDLPGGTRNVAAYDALKKAQEMNWGSADQILEAIGIVREVTDQDPNYAQAWLTLYRLYSSAIGRFPPGRATEYPGLAQQALEKAEELAPDMSFLHVIYAFRAINLNADWLEADRLLTEGLSEYGNSVPELVGIYSQFLLATGNVSEAVPVAERARRLDPLSTTAVNTLISARLINEDYERALAEYQRHAELYPELASFGVRLMIAWQSNNITEYARLIREYYADESNPPRSLSEEFYIKFIELLEANDADYALAEVRRMMESGDYSVLELDFLQGIANQYGDAQLQADMVDRFRRNNSTRIYDWAARAEIYRKIDAFKARMERNGLADYWRSTGNWPDKCQPLEGNDDFECF